MKLSKEGEHIVGEIDKHIDILDAGITASFDGRVSREHMAYIKEFTRALKYHIRRIATIYIHDKNPEVTDELD